MFTRSTSSAAVSRTNARRFNTTPRTVLGAAVLGAGLLVSAQASAGPIGGPITTIPRFPRCVQISAPHWNAPKGAAVFSRSSGPIRAVTDAIGEHYTHVVLSASSSRGIEATSDMPSARSFSEDGFCDAPLNFDNLENAQPGTRTFPVTLDKYGDDIKNTNDLVYRPGRVLRGGSLVFDQGSEIVDRALGLVIAGTSFLQLAPGRGHTPYFWNQYMDIGSVASGDLGWSRGVVCSGLLSFLQGASARAGGFGMPTPIAPHLYTHDQTAAAGYRLYDEVKETASSAIGPWKSAFTDTVGCGFRSPAAHAAAQMRNCMAFDDCRNGEPDRFDGAVGDPSFRAKSVSPDRIGGEVATVEDNASVWAGQPKALLQVNSDPVYVCF